MREKFELKFDDKINIIGYIWKNDNVPTIGTIQISHGMAEHILRYDDLAKYLSNFGYIVIGHDHIGHGLTAGSKELVGEILNYDFLDAIIKGIKQVRDEFSEYFLSGSSYIFSHSMGAMAMLRYLELYPGDFNKVVLSGPDGFSFKYRLAKILTGLFNKKGKIVYSNFVLNLSIGSFNKKFKNIHPKYGWLSSNLDNIYSYNIDPFCGKDFPVNYFHSLSKMMVEASKSKNIDKINKDTHIFLYSGALDPVNNFHKALIKLYKVYKKHNLNVIIKSYDGAHHEVHNEKPIIKEEVYQDIVNFFKK